MHRRFIFILLLISLLFNISCSKDSPQEMQEKDKLKVYATIYPIYDFAQKIGGDKIDLNMVIPFGAEPHHWEPSGKLLGELEKADMLIYNGIGLEPWIDRVLGSINTEKLTVVKATEGIKLIRFDHEEGEIYDSGEVDDHNHGEYDPHVWLDPMRAVKMAENIKDALVMADEENRGFYEDNFNRLKEDLEELDALYIETLKDVRQRKIVVSHEAFGYLAERYGLEQIGIAGISPQNEPSPGKLAEISNLIREYDIKYIFFETLTSPKTAEVLARETGIKIDVLNPLGGLTEEEIREGKDYIKIMKDNLKVLEKALK